jgi:V/A-type H+-transporting ATPase subunit I
MGMGGPAVGRMLMLSGLFAAIIGTFVFGEALGLHFTSNEEVSWTSIFRGIDSTDHHSLEELPAHYSLGFLQLGYYSKLGDVTLLLKLSIGIALLHLNMGFVIGFFNVLRAHGMRHAVTEKLAWMILEAGLALWILSMFPSADPFVAPALGYLGLGLVGLSLVLLVAGHGALAIMELPSLATNTLSYTRLTAVGMSKAGLALVFNMFAFDMLGGGVGGWAVWVLGILFILPLAILAGGLHSLRLHFVEFFTKFYEGGGKRYEPFGRRSEIQPSQST